MRLAQRGFPTRYFALVTAIQLLSAGTIAIVTADEQSPDWISLSAKIQARSALEIIVFVCMRAPVHREVIAKLHTAQCAKAKLEPAAIHSNIPHVSQTKRPPEGGLYSRFGLFTSGRFPGPAFRGGAASQ
jgi:hypothetical protein